MQDNVIYAEEGSCAGMPNLKAILESEPLNAFRVIASFGAVVGLVFAVVVTILTVFVMNLCANNIICTSHSPDGKLKAVVFRRDCGATTGWSINVSVLKAKDTLHNQDQPNVWGQPGTWAETKWLDDRRLMIYHHQASFTPLFKPTFAAFDRVIKIEDQLVPQERAPESE